MDRGCEFFLCWVGIVSRLTFIHRSLVSGATRFVARCVCVILAKFQLIAKGNWNWMNWMKFTLLRCSTLPWLHAIVCIYLCIAARHRERALCIKLFLACATLFDLGRLCQYSFRVLSYALSCSIINVFCLIAEASEVAGSAEPARLVADRLSLSLSHSLSLCLSLWRAFLFYL